MDLGTTGKGSEAFHKTSPGETLWQISQKYGLTLKRLKRYNRIDGNMEPAAGTMLYLASRRPKDAVIAKVENPVEVNNQEAFNWSVTTESAGEEIVSTPPVVVNPVAEVLNTTPEGSSKDVDSLKILQTNKTTSTLEDRRIEEHLPLPEDNLHTVKAGETLYGIAKLYGITVMQLVSLNNLSLQAGIKPGQTLRLADDRMENSGPMRTNDNTSSENEFFHHVKTSDTLYSIARQYNVTIKQLMEWNAKKDFSLSVGEKLRILRTQ